MTKKIEEIGMTDEQIRRHLQIRNLELRNSGLIDDDDLENTPARIQDEFDEKWIDEN